MSTTTELQARRWAAYIAAISDVRVIDNCQTPNPADYEDLAAPPIERWLLICTADNQAEISLHADRDGALTEAVGMTNSQYPMPGETLVDLDAGVDENQHVLLHGICWRPQLGATIHADRPDMPDHLTIVAPDTATETTSVTLKAAGLTISVCASEIDGKIIVQIDTPEALAEIGRTAEDGLTRPASEQGPDLRIRLNDALVHGLHPRGYNSTEDMPMYHPDQILQLNADVQRPEQAGAPDPDDAQGRADH